MVGGDHVMSTLAKGGGEGCLNAGVGQDGSHMVGVRHRAWERGPTQEGKEEAGLFDKVIVEEAIKYGVGAGGGDSKYVADKEYYHHGL